MHQFYMHCLLSVTSEYRPPILNLGFFLLFDRYVDNGIEVPDSFIWVYTFYMNELKINLLVLVNVHVYD